MSLLDDLMDVGEPGPETQPPRGRSGQVRLVVRIAVVAAAGAALIDLFALAVSQHTVSPVFLFVGLVALQVLFAVLAWVRNPQLPDTVRYPVASPDVNGGHLDTRPRDGLALATDRWNRQMAWYGLHMQESAQFARTLQPRLARLVTDRLRLRHGITITSDPTRARKLLGEPLWSLVTTPARRAPTARDLSALVKQMEKI